MSGDSAEFVKREEARLREAVGHHEAGRVKEAELAYREILEASPGHADANHNLGVLLMQAGKATEALLYLKAALEALPAQGQYWLTYIAGLIQAGETDGARQVLAQGRQRGLQGPAVDKLENEIGAGAKQAEIPTHKPSIPTNTEILSLFNTAQYGKMEIAARESALHRPNDAMVWHLLSVAMLMQGKSEDALEPLNRCIRLNPEFAEAHSNLGNAMRSLNRLDRAIEAYECALRLKPKSAEIENNLGAVFHQLGDLEKSLLHYQWAIEHKPNYIDAIFNKNAALTDLGRTTEAIAGFESLLRLCPEHGKANYHLGTLLADTGNPQEALERYQQALSLDPDNVDAWEKLGLTLAQFRRYDEAVAAFRRLLELQPDSAYAYVFLADTLCEQEKYAEALASYKRAMELDATSFELYLGLGKLLTTIGRNEDAIVCFNDAKAATTNVPDDGRLASGLGLCLERAGRIDEAIEVYRTALADNPGTLPLVNSSLLFALNYHPTKSAEEIYQAYQEYDEQYGKPYLRKWRERKNSRELGRRLKVGYVSPDFRDHPVGKFLEPVLSHHDKGEVEVYAYAELSREDAVTERYRGYVDHWVETRGLSDEAVAERVRADGIDVLVDVAGHTTGNRLGVFARKPAPVSVSWLGYSYTTGLSAIDYFLTDWVSAPEGSEGLYSEEAWRLEGGSLVYRPAEGMGECGELPALGRGFVTYGTLTRAVRINERVIRVWSEILKRVEGSRLVFNGASYQDGKLNAKLVQKFELHGIDPQRLELGCDSPPWEVLRGMDIGLDCFPHNSGTTLFEQLYMGVPYVTLADRPSVGRIGGSILTGLGHGEWIAKDEGGYVEKAVELGRDLGKLAKVRAGLRGEMEAGPLRDEAGFTRKLEKAYRQMFERWARRVEAG